MTSRINARVDPELARKVKYLQKQTGGSVSDVVKASIEAYFAQVQERQRPLDVLGDFIGCAEGPANLSEEYKSELTRSLEGKA